MTSPPDERRMISFRIAAVIAACIMLAQLAITVFLAGNTSLRSLLSNLIVPLVGCLATVCLFYAAYSSEKGSRIRMAWTVLAMAELCYTLGDIIWAVLEVVLAQQPFPSVADIPYLAFYILFALGILMLPAVPLTRGERLKMMLDMGIVMIAAFLGFWVFLLDPVISTFKADTLALALSLAYPVMDLVLLLALLQLLFRRFGFYWHGPKMLLAAGAAVKIIADVVYIIPSLERTYASGGLLDAGWMSSILLFGLAGVLHVSITRSSSSATFPDPKSRHFQLTWPRYLPYFAAASAYILLIWSRDNLMHEFPRILWGVGAIVGLVIVRQVVALNENSQLYALAQKEIAERKKSEEVLRETRDYLENLIDYANAPIIVWDPSFRVTRFNHAFERLTGLDDEEVLGQPLNLLFPEKSSEESMAYISRALSGERWEAVEIPICRKDGSVKTILWNSANVHDKAGEVVATIAQGQDITERKEAEEALHKSEARYRAIVEDQTELICRSLPDGTLTFVNDAYCRYFGKKREELIGINFFPLIPDEDHVKVKTEVASINRQEPVATYEHRVSVKGELRWTEWTDRAIFDESGSLFEIQSVGRDITENKRAAEEIKTLNQDLENRVLRRTAELQAANIKLNEEMKEREVAEQAAKESETLLATVLDAIQDVIGVMLPDRTILRYNKAGYDFLGIKQEEAVGKKCYQLMGPQECSVCATSLVLKSKKMEITEKYIPERGMYLDCRSHPLLDEKGDVKLVIEQLRDVTSVRRAQEALLASEKKYRQLVETLREGIWVMDKDGYTTYVNSHMADMLGYTVEEMQGRHLFSFMDEKGIEIAKFDVERRREGIKEQRDFEFMRKDGSRMYTTMETGPIFDAGGNYSGLIAGMIDITERKRAEEKMAASLQEKEMLLREVHHRVKNNLQVISSLLNLQSEHIKDKKALEMFRESQNRVISMAKIHEKLYRSGDLARIDFAEYIQSLACDLLRSYGPGSNKVNLKINVHDVRLGIDTAIPCGLIINELVSNSLKHAFPEGRGGEIRVDLLANDDHSFTLIVADDGIGLPEEIGLRKTESLGLLLVSTLTQQLKGNIEVDRSRGTEFRITFSENNPERQVGR